MTKSIWLVRAFLGTVTALSILALRVDSQNAKPSPIRVNSTLVVVRAEVLDKEHMFSVSPEEKECMRADQQSFHDLSLTQAYIPKACWGLVVRDLKASDFHLFADGKEQTIQGFNLERSNILVRDNLGAHNEFSYTPTAKWSSVDLPHPGPSASVSEAENFFYFYNLAFNPEGGAVKPCHQIRLKVDRPHTLVYYRPEYCLQETPADLLEGSDLAKQMGQQTSATYRKKNGRDYASKPGAFALEYQIGSLHLGNGTSRVLLSIEFAGGRLRRHWEWRDNWWELQASIAVLGVIRSRDGTEVTRFSDLGCCSDYSTARLFAETGPVFSPLAVKQMAGIAEFRIPVRYENQFELPVGDYELRLALSDGARVDRIQAQFRIENPQEQPLGLSSVMLGKRVQDAHVALEEVAAAENFAPQYVPPVSKGVQVTPSGSTHFRGNEEMLAYFEVYVSKLESSLPKVQVHVRISDAPTGVVKSDVGIIDAAPYVNPGSTTIPILVRIPFNTLPKGSYNLEVQATDSSGQSTPWRGGGFTVE